MVASSAQVLMPGRSASDDDIEKVVAQAALDVAAGRPLSGVGVSAAGLVDRAGERVRFAAHLPWRDAPVRARLEERIGAPVVLDNDANCAAHAELVAGALRGVSSALLVTVGTGIGGAVVLDGRVVRGANGMAGEFGHVQVVPGRAGCECGLRGCWEQYCSGRALERSCGSHSGRTSTAPRSRTSPKRPPGRGRRSRPSAPGWRRHRRPGLGLRPRDGGRRRRRLRGRRPVARAGPPWPPGLAPGDRPPGGPDAGPDPVRSGGRCGRRCPAPPPPRARGRRRRPRGRGARRTSASPGSRTADEPGREQQAVPGRQVIPKTMQTSTNVGTPNTPVQATSRSSGGRGTGGGVGGTNSSSGSATARGSSTSSTSQAGRRGRRSSRLVLGFEDGSLTEVLDDLLPLQLALAGQISRLGSSSRAMAPAYGRYRSPARER